MANIIKNKKEICFDKERGKALRIIEAGISSVLPFHVVKSLVKYDKKNGVLTIKKDRYRILGKRVFIIGAGKASCNMAKVMENVLGDRTITKGVVICKKADFKMKKVKLIEAGHPIPNAKSIYGANEILSLKSNCSLNENDIVISLISGGGSSLMATPPKGISLKDIKIVNDLLIKSGANIREINCVRKHLSRVKGGHLAKHYWPVKIISLIISDVAKNRTNVIASGPTSPDSSTFSDAYNILDKYNLSEKIPCSVIKFLKRGIMGKESETPKQLTNCKNYIIADNRLALNNMAKQGINLGFKPFIITNCQKGDPEKIARKIASKIINGYYKKYNLLLMGGEMTPSLPKNSGKGGRNQHFVAAFMFEMMKYNGDWLVASFATDGSDFINKVGGAIADSHSLAQVKKKSIDVKCYLKKFNSYNLFKKIGGSLLLSKDTGTNVGDVTLFILK